MLWCVLVRFVVWMSWLCLWMVGLFCVRVFDFGLSSFHVCLIYWLVVCCLFECLVVVNFDLNVSLV